MRKKNSKMINACFPIRNEISITNDGLLLRSNKIIIPSNLQQKIISLGHEGHQGIKKTQDIIKEKVWFPDLNSMVKETV